MQSGCTNLLGGTQLLCIINYIINTVTSTDYVDGIYVYEVIDKLIIFQL